MPEFRAIRSKRFVAARTAVATVAAAVVGASALVVLSGQGQPAEAAVAPGSTVRASVHDRTGAESERGGQTPSLAADGDSVAFLSTAALTRLARDGENNVYVRDLARGRTILISRGQFTRLPDPPPPDPGPHSAPSQVQPQSHVIEPGETEADGGSWAPTISGDGRFVAFMTSATNLVEHDADWHVDIVLCDRDPDGDGEFDERRDNGSVDYRYHLITEPTTNQDGNRIDQPFGPRLAGNGSRIIWRDSRSQRVQVITRHLGTLFGVAGVAPQAVLPGPNRPVPSPLPGAELTSQADAEISYDGNFVVLAGSYVIPSDDDAGPDRPFTAIVRVDLRGTPRPTVTRVDLEPDGTRIGDDEDAYVHHPAVSGDGSLVAFTADRLRSEHGYQPNVYVVRPEATPPPDAEVDSTLVSLARAGRPANGTWPALSADGRYLAFLTDSRNMHDGVDGDDADSCLVPNIDSAAQSPGTAALPPHEPGRDERVYCQVVVRDLVADAGRAATGQPQLPATLASPGLSRDCVRELPADEDCAANRDSYGLITISADGGRVAYESSASDLVPDDGNQRTDTFVRTFTPSLAADPVQFGQVTEGESATATATVRHAGFGPLRVGDVFIAGNDVTSFVIDTQNCAGVTLHQGEVCFVEVRFTPNGLGDRSAVLVVRAPGERDLLIDLRGTGVPRPEPRPAEFRASPDPLNFGEQLLRSDGPGRVVTVTNTGATALKFGAVVVSDDSAPFTPDDFALGTNTCVNATVPPGGRCRVTVEFSPLGDGARSAVLRFDSDAPGAPHLVGLRGRGTEPAIEVNPAVILPGRVTSVAGTGFPPLTELVVRYAEIWPESATVTTDADGSFTTPLLVFPKASAGGREVIAFVDGVNPAVEATAPLLVVLPTSRPPEFTDRN